MPESVRSLDSIFLEAAEFPEGELRHKFLDEACGADNDLKARVERLLAAVPRIGSFMEAPAFQPSTIPTDHLLPMVDLTGQAVGPYKLLQELGEGGMGVVYMAEQDHPVRRRVAVKVIRAGMDSSHVAARFEQERFALAMMDHPNIARVLDAGTTGDGRLYFAMELVQGISITEYCDQEHLSINARLELFIPVCRAIQHAHQKGIIHRDLKPSNVIVGTYDEQPVPKVIDFGVAKAVGQRLIDRTMFAIYKKLAAEAPTVSHYRDQLAISSNNLGELLLSQDDNAQTEVAFRQTLTLRRQLAAEFPAVPEYQRGVAITLSNLGILLKNTERWQEAEDVYRQALVIHEQLAMDYPQVVAHQNEVAGALVNLARILLMRKELQGARELLEQALPHHQAALQASPNHPAYRNFYRLNRWRLTETLLELQDHAAAADTAGQFLQAAVELPRDAYTTACLLATCIKLAEVDEHLTANERQDCVTAYGDNALAALRQAIAAGFKDVEQLKSDAILDPLRSQEGFQSLLSTLDPEAEK